MLRWATLCKYHLSKNSMFTNNEKKRKKGHYLLSSSICWLPSWVCFWQQASAHPSLLRWENHGLHKQAWLNPDWLAARVNNLPSLNMKKPSFFSYFPCALAEWLTKKQGFILAHGLKAQPLMVRRHGRRCTWQLGKLYPHSGSRDESRCSTFMSLLYSAWDLAWGRKHHHRHTQRCVSMEILKPSSLTTKINHYELLHSLKS